MLILLFVWSERMIVHTISNKTFDFSKTTIQQLIQDGYEETKEQMKEVIANQISEKADV